MELSGLTRLRLRTVGIVVFAACAISPFFNYYTNEDPIQGTLQGVLDAFFIALILGGYVVFAKDALQKRYLRRFSFLQNLIIQSAIYLVLFLVVRSLGQFATTGSVARMLESFGDPHLRWAIPFFFSLAMLCEFGLMLNRMLGSNALRNFVMGTYHRPLEEERIFMFLDLEGSTRLAEELGAERFYGLLSRFVDDLTVPILDTRGEIYQYAGDEVVITWRKDRGAEEGACLRCFFMIRDRIARNASSYLAEFGTVPKFRAGVHGGTTIAGELGDIKREIVFVGDILNTAARLEEYAKTHALPLVVSGAVIGWSDLPRSMVLEHLGAFQPRGKSESIEIFRVDDSG
ncbi:MAG: adenylate/guanylate cyclase domain-containing protein [bacterium]|nr:adenylate/guanylate cyclase domain-containing protein [bacterium]